MTSQHYAEEMEHIKTRLGIFEANMPGFAALPLGEKISIVLQLEIKRSLECIFMSIDDASRHK